MSPAPRADPRVARAVLVTSLALGACATAAPRSDAPPDDRSPPPGVTSREIDLAAWGLASVDDLRFAETGLLEEVSPRLVVYHAGPADPARGGPGGSARHASEHGRVAVHDARSGNVNRLGGFFNGFARAPARARVTLDDGALAFEFDRPPGTFAGFWVHLFDSTRPIDERVYLDAAGLGFLTFEVRGEVGDEPLRLQVADRDRELGEGSLAIDDVGVLVPAGRVTTAWQRAWLPLERLAGMPLDRARLASLVMLVDPGGASARAGRVFVRDIAFTIDREAPRPPATAEAVATAAPSEAKAPRRAMWLWETAQIAADPRELDALCAFVAARGLTDLFVQVPFVAPRTDAVTLPAFDEAALGRLVARLSAIGARVYALDGAAWYARPSHHDEVVALIDRLGAWSARQPAGARLHGVRMDVEPYLLPEWQGAARARVLADYRDLMARMVSAAHAHDLVFGADIPFWWDARAERSGEPVAALDGRPASEVVIDLVDDIGLMDYRTSAFGADGVLAHGAGELAYASARGRHVFIGLETVPLPDERIALWDDRARSQVGIGAELAVEPLAAGRARLTWIPAAARRVDGRYPWLASGARLLRQRSQLVVPASKITFATQGLAALERTMAEALPVLAAEPSFVGFAVHSYESYRRWFPGPSVVGPAPDR